MERRSVLHPDRGLTGASALITGAGGDIGRATAIALGRAGASVALVGRDENKLRATAAEMPECDPHILPTDLTDADAVARLVADLDKRFDGGLDVLIHCAGVYRRGRTELAPLDELDQMYDSNVRAPYRLTQHLLPPLRSRQGHVVFVTSTQGLVATESVGQYAATQQAMKAVADSLRQEVNASGVRVLTLFAGRTAGQRQEKIFAEEGKPYQPELLLQPTEIANVIVNCLTLPRTAEVTNLTIRPAIKTY